MEQTTQQVTQKPPFPIKTKVIAWIMTVIGLLGIIAWMLTMFKEKEDSILGFDVVRGFLIPVIFGFFFPGIWILRRKRVGWWLAIAYISFLAIVFIMLNLFPMILPLIILFILLLLDRKNFFKIAS